MTLTFAGTLDHAAVVRAVDALVDLVESPDLGDAWARGSSLPGMTVGGLVRHLVSQPECAVQFLGHGSPPHAQVLSLADYFERVDWLLAPVDAPENTSIRDDFNEMAGPGVEESRAILERSRAELGAAIEAAGPAVYVPWQDCSLQVDDFLVVRLMEIVVHADDLAASLGRPTPGFEPAVLEPVLALLAALAARRRGQDELLRTLARTERAAGGSVSAF